MDSKRDQGNLVPKKKTATVTTSNQPVNRPTTTFDDRAAGRGRSTGRRLNAATDAKKANEIHGNAKQMIQQSMALARITNQLSKILEGKAEKAKKIKEKNAEKKKARRGRRKGKNEKNAQSDPKSLSPMVSIPILTNNNDHDSRRHLSTITAAAQTLKRSGFEFSSASPTRGGFHLTTKTGSDIFGGPGHMSGYQRHLLDNSDFNPHATGTNKLTKVVPEVGPLLNLTRAWSPLIPTPDDAYGFKPMTMEWVGAIPVLTAVTGDTNSGFAMLRVSTHPNCFLNYANTYTSQAAGLEPSNIGGTLAQGPGTSTLLNLSNVDATAWSSITGAFDRIIPIGTGIHLELMRLVPGTSASSSGRIAYSIDESVAAISTVDPVLDDAELTRPTIGQVYNATIASGAAINSDTIDAQLYHDGTAKYNVVPPGATPTEWAVGGVSTQGMMVVLTYLPTTTKIFARIRYHFMVGAPTNVVLNGTLPAGSITPNTYAGSLANTMVDPIAPPSVEAAHEAIKDNFQGIVPQGTSILKQISRAAYDATLETGVPQKMLREIMTHGAHVAYDWAKHKALNFMYGDITEASIELGSELLPIAFAV